MSNLIVGLIILAIISGATAKIIIEKKKGTKCIGCPYADQEDCSCNLDGTYYYDKSQDFDKL
ncbi:MAG: FeoB-associated Cys-rich membrane protein [Halanaerobiales bacterium]